MMKLTFEDGYYEGDVVDGIAPNGARPHGKGKQTFANGAVYEEGDFADGNPHGKGKYQLKDGSVYEGELVDGNFHGKGKMTYPDGRVEEGRFENDKFVG